MLPPHPSELTAEVPSFPAALPAHLAGNQATGLAAHQTIAQFEIGDMRNFVYLVLDWPSRTAAIVDPQKDLSQPMNALKTKGFRLARILLTHSHADHTAGVQELVRAHPEVPVSIHPADLHRLPSAVRTGGRIEKLADGNVIRMGRIEIEVMHTPGHSAGECSYYIRTTDPHYLLTGDTVFVRDCGRTDFADGSNPEMFESIQRIKRLPPSTVILPGHHYAPEVATTIALELEQSPPFKVASVAELEALP